MTDWRVGMEAQCIVDGLPDILFMQIYVVAEVKIIEPMEIVQVHRKTNIFDAVIVEPLLVLRLVRISGYAGAKYFRPVTKTKTDISVFTSLLKPVKVPEDA